MSSGSEKPVLEPLLLPNLEQDPSCGRTSPKSCIPCMMCAETFEITTKKEDFLRHLLTAHRLVIADVNLIANFKRSVFRLGQMKKICAFRVTWPYLNVPYCLNLDFIQVFWKKKLYAFRKAKCLFKMHKIIFFSRKKYICMPTLPKIFRPITRSTLVFFWLYKGLIMTCCIIPTWYHKMRLILYYHKFVFVI